MNLYRGNFGKLNTQSQQLAVFLGFQQQQEIPRVPRVQNYSWIR